MADKPWQIAGAAGILFVVLFVIGAILGGDPPMYNDPGEDIAAWYVENSDQRLVSDFIVGLGFILFYFPFLSGLYSRLRLAEGEPALWSRVALLGGVTFPLAGLAGGMLEVGLALLEGNVSADVASLASAASYHAFMGAAGLAAVLMGGASLAILRTGVFWKWLGWLGVVLAILLVVGGASTIENDPEGVLAIIGVIGFIGFGVWVLATSVALLQTREGTEVVSTSRV